MDNSQRANGEAAKSESDDSPGEASQKVEEVKKPLLARGAWDALGLDVSIILTMIKGALPPAIAVSLYQWDAFAAHFSTIGYLVAIMAILSFATMPRAKFIQTMTFNILGICIGAAVALLEIYCAVQARAHTAPPQPMPTGGAPSPGAQVAGYNSSASAVCAIWLFFNIYVANLMRASRPQLQFPVIMYSIFTNVASTYAPQFSTMIQGIAFVERLLEAFLAGFGIAVIVSFAVLPATSRRTVLKKAAGYIEALRAALKAQSIFLQSLEDKDNFGTPEMAGLEHRHENPAKRLHHKKTDFKPKLKSQAAALKAAAGALGELHGTINVEIAFAKREIALGKLDATDIGQLVRLLRSVMVPIVGMSSVADIFDRVADRRGWREASDGTAEEREASKKRKDGEKSEWSDIMKSLHGPFEDLTGAVDEGLQHALYVLELSKRPKSGRASATSKHTTAEGDLDVEAKGELVKPGDDGFVDFLSTKVGHFCDQRQLALNTWRQQKGVRLDQKACSDPQRTTSANDGAAADLHLRIQRQLYLLLYMEFLLWSTGQAVIDLVRFADLKKSQGVMRRNRLIFPGRKRLKKWILGAFRKEDTSAEHTPDTTEATNAHVELGQAFRERRDPEHLPPTNAWQRFGNNIRQISAVLGSQSSAFGFRVACATMSIGIIAYLEATQKFFIEQRLLWAMIMVSIGMTVTAGAGVFGFIGRIAGTVFAMITSLLMWYIADGKTPGIIVLLFVFTFLEFYFVLKFPKFIVIALLSMVTQVLIVGYELQVQKVGEQVATSNGQPVYPIYELAPYRLACVVGGMVVAFIWTFFPYALTARSQLRRDLGASLYLLANYYSCVHTTIGMRLSGTEGDPGDKNCPGRRLEKARRMVFSKELALLAGLRQHSAFTRWEPTLGGKFPRKQYDAIIEETQSILNFIALLSYASVILSDKRDNDPDQAIWLRNFARLVQSARVTSHGITSTLSLLSASVINGNPLPPYLKAPEPYQLSAKLEVLDADILSINHITEPGYAAFAVMQIATSLIINDLERLIVNVKELVGEVDFSFHIVSTALSSSETLTVDKGKKD